MCSLELSRIWASIADPRRIPAVVKSLLLALCGALLIASSSVQAGKGGPGYEMGVELSAVESLQSGRPMALTLTLTRTKETTARSLSVRLESWGGLTFIGDSTWQETLDERTSYPHEFRVVLPPEDTCGLCFCINLGRGDGCWDRSFIPQADGFTMVPLDARIEAKMQRDRIDAMRPSHPADDSLLNLIPDSMRIAERAQRNALRADSVDSIYKSMGFEKLPGGGYARVRQMTQAELDRAHMQELERQPCADPQQNYFVDGQAFVRYKGESKFHPAEMHTMQEWADMPRTKHTTEVKDTTSYEFLAEVTDSTQFKRVRAVAISLVATDRPNVYRVRMNKPSQLYLERFGVKCTPVPASNEIIQ